MWKKFHRKHAWNISNQHLTGLTEVQIYYKLSTILATQLVKGLTTNAPRRGVWGASPKKILKIKCSRSDSEGTWADLRHIRHIFKGHFCKDHSPPLGAPPPSRGGGAMAPLAPPLDPPLWNVTPRDHCCPRPQAVGNNDPEGWHSIMLHSKPVTICFIIHLIWQGWVKVNSLTQNSCFYYTSDLAWMSEFRHKIIGFSSCHDVDCDIWLLSMRETLLPCYDDLAVRNRS